MGSDLVQFIAYHLTRFTGMLSLGKGILGNMQRVAVKLTCTGIYFPLSRLFEQKVCKLKKKSGNLTHHRLPRRTSLLHCWLFAVHSQGLRL